VRARAAAFLVVLGIPRASVAQEKVRTCVHVEAAADREALARLVESEVDRHRSHQSAREGCATHLKVELVEIEGTRFLTGRIGGEVPDRVEVRGPGARALASALEELLRDVLGSDPVALRAPGGQSWFGEKALALRDRGRSTFDFAVLETATVVRGQAGFLPAVLLGFTREISDWQVGVEAMGAQTLASHPGQVGLDTELRLQATVTHFFSEQADVSPFVGFSFGIAHQRFSGPLAEGLGGGDGRYDATGPGLALRSGVELLRATSLRAFVVADALLPVFVASDAEGEIVSGWVPAASLGAGVRF